MVDFWNNSLDKRRGGGVGPLLFNISRIECNCLHYYYRNVRGDNYFASSPTFFIHIG